MDIFDKEQSKTTNNQSNSVKEDKPIETITELIEDFVLPSALKCGIGIEEFYEYTLGDIKLLMKAHQERQMEQLKLQAQMDYTQSITIANFVACMFSKDAQPPKFEELYSFLYSKEELEEIDEAKEEAKRQQQLEAEKAGWLAWAESFNKKQELKENNNKGSRED